MLLAVDVANTWTALGLYDGQTLVHQWHITTGRSRTEDELALVVRGLIRSVDLSREVVTAAIMASVVPSSTPIMSSMISRTFGVPCRVVGPGLKTGMPILYEDPREVGADRIANAVAARHRDQQPGQGVIIVDFGTATIFDMVNPDGAYLGGAISPGMEIAADALYRHAARLPRVEMNRPKQVVGRNTVASIQSGMVYGYVALVDGLVRRMLNAVDWPCRVVATGRLAPLVAPETETIERVDPHLTLDGLMLIHTRNK